MRFCLSHIPFVLLLVFAFGCSSAKVIQKQVRSETHVESNADGILVTKIIVAPSVEDPLVVLGKFGAPLVNQIKKDDLQMEGIEVRRVRADDVPEIVSAMGKAKSQENVWHGQIFKWRDIQQHQIPFQGMVVAKSGIPYFIESGFLSLLSRSWLVEREDGLFVYLQLLPSWHIPGGQSVVTVQQSRPTQSKLFSELGLEFLLSDGEAIVLAVDLVKTEQSNGPLDDGPSPISLGEAMLGISVEKNMVVMLVIEPNILPRK